jgi:hypothetical protein
MQTHVILHYTHDYYIRIIYFSKTDSIKSMHYATVSGVIVDPTSEFRASVMLVLPTVLN